MKKFVLLLLISVVFLGCGALEFSDGHRGGKLTKLSKKGVVVKTYEGELLLGDDANTVWAFTVRDEDVAKSLETYIGRNVTLHYSQRIMVAPWQSDTNYWVDSITSIEPNGQE